MLVAMPEFGFEWQLRFSHRKTIGVYVFPDLSVEVRAPKRTEQHDIIAFLIEHQQWVKQQLQKYQKNLTLKKPQFVAGAEHYYLGKSFPLVLSQINGKPRVEFNGEYIRVFCRDQHDSAEIKKHLIVWYRRLASVVYAARLEKCFAKFSNYPIVKPAFRIRTMKTRWGSCSSKGQINLSLELIQVPLACVDYVIVHELCHLIEFNHSPTFYALQSDIMPDWKQRKITLDAFPVVRLR